MAKEDKAHGKEKNENEYSQGNEAYPPSPQGNEVLG
jgi:hypothetical protein